MKTEYDIGFNEIKSLDCSHYGIYVGTILPYLTGKKNKSCVYIHKSYYRPWARGDMLSPLGIFTNHVF